MYKSMINHGLYYQCSLASCKVQFWTSTLQHLSTKPKKCIKSQYIQYADDTTCKVSNIISTIKIIESQMAKFSKWLSENSVIFKCDKLKHIISSSRRHKFLRGKSYLIRSEYKSIHPESSIKLLSVYFNLDKAA